MKNSATKNVSRGRIEDEAFLRGLGRYTGVHEPGALVGHFVRSDIAHARIVSLDLSAAREVPDVIAVFAMADLLPLLPKTPVPIDTIVNRGGTTTVVPPRPALASDRVRFVGEAYALAIARTEAAANEAAEAVSATFDEYPANAVLGVGKASADLHDDVPGNLGFDWQGGDAEAAALALSQAEHVVTGRFGVPRILGAPMEPFAVVASYDAETERYTLIAPSQGSHAIRRELADGYLGVAVDRLRVVTPDVGGAFGIRIHALPEQAALLAAARCVDQPIRWQSDRTESHLCEPHARDLLIEAELGLDGDGRFLGLRASAWWNIGAYVHPGARSTPTASLLLGLQGAYRMPALSCRVRGLYTNTTPVGPFRGAGQPEGTFVIERLIEQAGRHLAMSSTELRLRNVLDASSAPYRSATGHMIDCCDAADLVRRASAWLLAGTASEEPFLSGGGLALYVKVNGMGRLERAEAAVDRETGQVSIRIGSQSNGQGHATTFSLLAAERLGLDPEQVRVVQGDTDLVSFGTGTGASSALATTGSGVALSCADLLRVGRVAAAAHLGAGEEELTYGEGSFRVPGTNRFVTLHQLAAEAKGELLGRSEVGVSLTYTYGCHACRVRVDVETGDVELLDYAAFDDLGPILQPAIAIGQIHGGVAQGIGQALQEAVRYDGDAAQPVTATFLDYQVPRAGDLPEFACHLFETPSRGGHLGIRGAGEAGAIASMAAVVNAVDEALSGVADLDIPLTSQTVWRALKRRGAAR